MSSYARLVDYGTLCIEVAGNLVVIGRRMHFRGTKFQNGRFDLTCPTSIGMAMYDLMPLAVR